MEKKRETKVQNNSEMLAVKEESEHKNSNAAFECVVLFNVVRSLTPLKTIIPSWIVIAINVIPIAISLGKLFTGEHSKDLEKSTTVKFY